jgi:hypothetical protein
MPAQNYLGTLLDCSPQNAMCKLSYAKGSRNGTNDDIETLLKRATLKAAAAKDEYQGKAWQNKKELLAGEALEVCRLFFYFPGN